MFVHLDKKIVILLLLVTVSLSTLLAYHFVNSTPPLNDTVEYKNASENLLKNNTLYSGNFESPLDFRLYSKRTLGFPVFILFQGQSNNLVLLSSVFLYFVIFFMGLSILRHFTEKRVSIIVYIFLFLTHAALSIHCTLYMADLLVTASVTAVVLVFYSLKETVTQKIFYISVLWGICLLLKPVFLPTLILAPLLIVYFKIKTSRWHLTLIIPILVWTVGCSINLANTGVFEYSSISTINLGQYNAKLSVANSDGLEVAKDFTNSQAFDIPRTKAAYSKYKEGVRNKAIKTVLEDPISYIKVHITGMLKMIVDPGRFEIYTFFGINDKNVSLTELLYSSNWSQIEKAMSKNKSVLVGFIVLFVISIIKLFLSLFTFRSYCNLYFLLLVMVYFVAITGPVGAARFMLPVSILYIILAALGAQYFLALFQKGSKS